MMAKAIQAQDLPLLPWLPWLRPRYVYIFQYIYIYIYGSIYIYANYSNTQTLCDELRIWVFFLPLVCCCSSLIEYSAVPQRLMAGWLNVRRSGSMCRRQDYCVLISEGTFAVLYSFASDVASKPRIFLKLEVSDNVCIFFYIKKNIIYWSTCIHYCPK